MTCARPAPIAMAEGFGDPQIFESEPKWEMITLLSSSARSSIQRAWLDMSEQARKELMAWLLRASEKSWFATLDQLLLRNIDDSSFYLNNEVMEGLQSLAQASDFILRGAFSWLIKCTEGPLDLAQIQFLLSRISHFHRLDQDRNICVSFDLWMANSQRDRPCLAKVDQVIEKIASFNWRNLWIDTNLCESIRRNSDLSKIEQKHLAELIVDKKVHGQVAAIPRWDLSNIAIIGAHARKYIAPHYDEELIQEYLSNCQSLERKLGSHALALLLNRDMPNCKKEVYSQLKLLEILVELTDELGIFEIASLLQKRDKTTEELIVKFQKLHKLQIEQIQDQRNIDEQVRRFAQIEKKELSWKGELGALHSNFAQVCAQEEHYRELTKIEMKATARSLGQAMGPLGQLPAENIASLLTIARIAMHRVTGKYPYDVQILTVLKMLLGGHWDLKGMIAQVRTGEGKSICVGLLALCLALQNQSIDIISSSRYLAKRDQRALSPLFDYFDISSSHICQDHPPKESFDGQILFGTNSDFEFAHLWALLDGSFLRQWKRGQALFHRAFHVAIVDEVDNLFIDLAMNSARVGINTPNFFHRAYFPIYQLVGDCKSRVFEALCGDHSKWPPLLRDLRCRLDQFNFELDQNCDINSEDLTEKLKTLVRSAYIARYLKERNVDYVIKKEIAKAGKAPGKSIVIVDRENSGRLLRGSRWQGGIHEFLEIKHQLPPRNESTMPASISHSTYFNSYQQLFGLTGTLGNQKERGELESLYRVSTFEVPPNRPSQFRQLSPKIAHRDHHCEALLDEIRDVRNQSRSILLLLASIRKTEEFSAYLKKSRCTHLILNEQQVVNEERVIARAGQPNQVTIATNTAGRGTDIIVAPSSEERGGLHVVFAFYPINDRVQQQGFGRAARQGQRGSGRFVLSSDDPAVNKMHRLYGLAFFEKDAKEQFALLSQERTLRSKALSKKRLECAFAERIHHELLMSFLSQVAYFTKQLERLIGHNSLSDWSLSGLMRKGAEFEGREKAIDAQSGPSKKLVMKLVFIDRASAQGECSSQLEVAKEDLKKQMHQLWSQNMYGRLGVFSRNLVGAEFDEQMYRENLLKEFQIQSESWTPIFEISKNTP